MRNHSFQEKSLTMMVDESKKKERTKDCRGIENSTEKKNEKQEVEVIQELPFALWS